MRLLTDYHPEGVIVAWDTRPVHRLERFPGYKASRKPTPSLLKQQQPYLRPLVEAFGYRNVELEGYEADDVIGTLSLRADEQGIATCVISHDRDAFQLVSEHVSVLLSPRGVTDVHVYTPERVEARYGIPPRLVPDFIGLKGDTSDDIPGVPGIGDKTAADLLVRFGSLEGIYANVDAVPGEKRRQTLIEHREDAERSKLLATIERDLPLDVDLGAGAGRSARPRDHGRALPPLRVPRAAAPHRRARGRRAAAPRSSARSTPSAPSAANAEALARAARRGRARSAWPATAAGLLGVARGEQALLIEESDATAVLAGGASADRRPQLQAVRRRALRGRRRARVRHRAGRVPDRSGPQRVRPRRPARRAGPRRGRAPTATATPCWRAAPRARCCCTRRSPRASTSASCGPLLEDIELPLVPVLCAMERAGVAIDSARMGEIAARVSEQVEALEQQADELAGRAVRARLAQAARRGALRAPRSLPAGRRGKTGYSTDSKVLAKMRDLHPIVRRRRGVARALEAALDLPAAVPGAARRGRPPAHDVLAGHGRDGPALGAAPEPAEHPDPHAARARAARDVRGRARATACSRSTTRRSSCASSRTSRARSCCARRSRAARTSTR